MRCEITAVQARIATNMCVHRNRRQNMRSANPTIAVNEVSILNAGLIKDQTL
jgi:hypothetical protein